MKHTVKHIVKWSVVCFCQWTLSDETERSIQEHYYMWFFSILFELGGLLGHHGLLIAFYQTWAVITNNLLDKLTDKCTTQFPSSEPGYLWLCRPGCPLPAVGRAVFTSSVPTSLSQSPQQHSQQQPTALGGAGRTLTIQHQSEISLPCVFTPPRPHLNWAISRINRISTSRPETPAYISCSCKNHALCHHQFPLAIYHFHFQRIYHILKSAAKFTNST